MPIHPRTKVKLLRFTAGLFALSSALSAFVAYSAHQSGEPAALYVKLSIMWLSVCVVFLTVAQLKASKVWASQREKDVSPSDPK